MSDPVFKQEREAKGGEARPAAQSGGATDIFATLPAKETGPESKAAPTWSAEKVEDVPSPHASETPGQRSATPVVHEVTFRKDAGTQDGSEALRNLLHSSPPPAAPARSTAAAEAGSTAQPAAPARKDEAPNGGFTQLLRALNFDQVKGEPAKPAAASSAAPVASPHVELGATGDQKSSGLGEISSAENSATAARTNSPGSFTQLFQTLESSPKSMPGGSAPPLPLPAEPIRPAGGQQLPLAPDAAESPGSFTQMFQALSAAETQVPPQQPGTVSQPAVPETSQTVGGPGSFTQLFKTLDASPSVAERSRASENFESPGSVRRPEETVAAKPVAATATTPAAASFTQMFQALDTPAKAPTAGPEPATAPSAPADSSRGSFTQMFQALDAPAHKAPVEPPREQPRAAVPAEAGPGEFTRMFNTLAPSEPGPPPAAASPATASPATASPAATASPETAAFAPAASPAPSQAGPGSFTQLFKTLDTAPEPDVRASDSARRDLPRPGSFAEFDPGRRPVSSPLQASDQGMGASQVFSSFAPAVDAKRPADQGDPFGDRTYNPPVPRQTPAPPAAGGLTQLLRTLDQAPPSPAPAGRAYEVPAAAPAQPSSFTSAYESLDSPQRTQPAAPDPLASRPAPPAANPAPNFASAEAMKAIPPASFPAGSMPAISTTPQAHAAGAAPSEFTRLVTASALREAGLRPGSTGAGTAQLPHAALPAMPVIPAVPAIPPVKLEAPAAGKMQQLLPLLLILIIILLVAILVTVVILMKK